MIYSSKSFSFHSVSLIASHKHQGKNCEPKWPKSHAVIVYAQTAMLDFFNLIKFILCYELNCYALF